MDTADRCGLRGLLIHVAPVIRRSQSRRAFVRAICPTVSIRFGPVNVLTRFDKAAGIRQKRCPWCLLPNKLATQYWHVVCLRYYTVAKLDGAKRQGFPRQDCPCGERGIELDHRVALVVAWRQGPRAQLRALLEANLQWLCHACHLVKTKADIREGKV